MPSPVEANIDGQARIRTQASTMVAAAWDQLQSYNDDDADHFVLLAAAVVYAAQRASIALTNAYIAAVLNIAPPKVNPNTIVAGLRDGVTPQETYRRPFVTTWTALSKDTPYDEAVAAGRARAKSAAAMDVQLAHFATYQAAQDVTPKIKGYKRRADGGACSYCRMIDGAFVKSASAAPLHNFCGCGLEPVLVAEPVTPLPEGVAVHTHGELGALITAPDQHFTRL